MMPQLTLSGGEPLLLQASSLRKFRGIRLPGSEYWFAEGENFGVHFHEFAYRGFSISYRIFYNSSGDLSITIAEDPACIRMEAMLTGSMFIINENTPFEGGQYRIIQHHSSSLNVPANVLCRWISISVQTDFIGPEIQEHTDKAIDPLPPAMKTMLLDLLSNRYQPGLLSFYYENCVRELFFAHLLKKGRAEEIPLLPDDLIAVTEAEKIIRENLHLHFSIQELARKTGTNEYKLKRGFRQVYKTGMFGHLLRLRMQHAAKLLETTSIPVRDIAEQTGYETIAGFITAFRKHHGLPPGEWRIKHGKE